MLPWLILSATLVFIFVIDDLFIDFYSIIKNLGPKKAPTDFDIKTLNKKLAIMVANWQEYGVLRQMVETNATLLNDPNIEIFLGVYPNDTKTAEVAFELSNKFSAVHIVVNTVEGPTYKGQMINEIIKYISSYEDKALFKFDGFIIHDSEDLISPESMHIFRHELIKSDFIQVPVISLPLHWSELTGATYLDEFSEVHSKDLLVRESLATAVPSAGVGTCLSRNLVQHFCTHQQGDLFAEKNLTEDYILGMEAFQNGFKTKFACYWNNNKQLVATREFFPQHFWSSVKQKTRWTLGISFQGWLKLGWFGSIAQRYFLWRDRKALFASWLTLNSLFVLVFLLVKGIEPIQESTFLSSLLWLNLFASILRLCVRGTWVFKHYGLLTALLIPLRWPWATAINTLASLRATKMFLMSLISEEELKWEKTQHIFPQLPQLQKENLILREEEREVLL